MSGHTPGPWRVAETYDGHEIRMGRAINGAQYGAHELIEYRHGLQPELWEEQEPETRQWVEAAANARLIAAAPEMLEALEKIASIADPKVHGALDDEEEDDEDHGMLWVGEIARKAIDKATGGTR